MTILVAILLGTGVLFIASAMDNTPIITTFQKIVSGQPIDWTGGNSTSSTGNPVPQQIVTPGTGNSCPPGYTLTVDPATGKKVCTIVADQPAGTP